jgi:protein O-mannosyl-transferase
MKKNIKSAKRSDKSLPDVQAPKQTIEEPFNKKVIPFYLVIAITCIGLYLNSIKNDYCLDDAMMITQNRFTQQGFAGIKEHLSHGFLYGFLPPDPSSNKNAGSSRWRPLPLITYSVEIGLWGNNKPHYSHLINILLYTLLTLVLFHVLRKYIFKDLWLAFFSTLLFAIHPIHTEVVTNIKGRDELLCFLFLFLSLWSLAKSIQTKSTALYLTSLLLFFISLTAKENSFTFIIGIPLILYFFFEMNLRKILIYSSGFLITVFLFSVIRNAIVPVSDLKPATEIMNNPYLYAKGFESICTKIYVLLLYAKMMFIPFPLSYDYSYNQIPYVSTGNLSFWIAFTFYLTIFIIAVKTFKSKNIISFCILMYLLTISISSNILVEIGLILGERLLFLPSVFVCMLIAVLGYKLVEYLENKTKLSKRILAGILILPVFILSSIVIVARNKDWKDDISLNLADVKSCPNSTRINVGAGNAYILMTDQGNYPKKEKDSLLLLSLTYFKKAVAINPLNNDAYLNIGVAYSRLDDFNKTEESWNEARKIFPDHPKLQGYDQFLAGRSWDLGIDFEKRSIMDSAILFYSKSIGYYHQNDTLKEARMLHLSAKYYFLANYQKSYETLGQLLELFPNNANAQEGYRYCADILKRQGALADTSAIMKK